MKFFHDYHRQHLCELTNGQHSPQDHHSDQSIFKIGLHMKICVSTPDNPRPNSSINQYSDLTLAAVEDEN